ncbi:Uncharacterised protein [Mycobacteroides abscessus subsp. abscessus]|nr:Uncharacterised protein [Mycobacteroides abscessus subsp. abscessus]
MGDVEIPDEQKFPTVALDRQAISVQLATKSTQESLLTFVLHSTVGCVAHGSCSLTMRGQSALR